MYIDELDDMINKCNNTYHRTVKIKPVDVKSSTYIKSSKEVNHQGPKFKIGGIIRISQYKNIFPKAMFLIGLKKFFVTKKVKNTVSWTCVISDLKGEKIVGMFYSKELQKQIKKCLKGDKLYVKWKGILLTAGLIKKT